MARAEVTVLGAGIFGLSIAWEMVRRGVQVRVVDVAQAGAGASGGIVGALSPHVPENWNPKKQFQLESLLMAEAFWQGVEDAGGTATGYARTGRLQPLADDAAIAQAERRATGAAKLWGDAASWAVCPVPKGWGITAPTGLVVRDTLSARISPRHACCALVAAIRAKGGRVEEGATEAPEGLVIHATGFAGLRELSAALGQEIGGGVKGQALSVDLPLPPDAPQLYADSLHIVPHLDGTVAIGSTSENAWDAPDTTDAQLDALHARAIAACPILAGAPVVTRWAGIRPRAKSRAPMLGAWPERAGHFVANGGFKIGFGMAPKVAEVMADLVLDGVDKIPKGFRVADNL